MCGIAYELLYARLLTTLLGDMFHVAAAILAAFLLGIAAGSRAAHRFARWLWAVELGIGLYALLAAAVFHFGSEAILATALPAISGSPAALVGLVFALLLAPALLIGFSVPLFTLTLRMQEASAPAGAAFGATYRAYNLGAAACVLATEFVLLRALGIRGALLAMAAVNAVTALALLRVPTPQPEREQPPEAPVEGARSDLLALFAVSVASGVYQMFFYKLVETIFGPFHENFAVVLAAALLGLWAGTRVLERWPVPFSRWLLRSSLAVAVSLLALAPAIHAWAAIHGAVGSMPFVATLFKLAVVAAVGGAPFVCFGGTVPALLRGWPETRSGAGRALAVSGLGNCCGYLATVLWLYAALPDPVIAMGIASTAGAAGAALAARGGLLQGASRPLAAALAGVAALGLAWPERLLSFSHEDFASTAALRTARERYTAVALHRRFDSQIGLLTRRDGGETLNINGYQSVSSYGDGRTNPLELIYGLMPAMYSARRERAMVLGVGTGITAGATATVYDAVLAVEVNPSILEILPHFAEHNLGLAEMAHVELVLDDGLTALVRSPERFDAIVNTVTSPLYFSSSKLYTRDFLELVARKLAPGGVYAMWFDSRVTSDGARIIFRTVAEVFADCAATYLNGMYLQLLCGNESLAPRGLGGGDFADALVERIAMHALGLPVERILPALSLDASGIFAREWTAPTNTFDRPALEFLMASRSWESHQDWSPYALMDARITSFPGRPGALSGTELADRCFVLRWISRPNRVRVCEAALFGSGDLPAVVAYADLVGAHERADRGLLSAAERLRLVEALLAAGETGRAARLVARREALPRERLALFMARARVKLAQGEPLDDGLLAHLHGAAPMHPGVRELIARAAAQRGDLRAGLRHLAFLEFLGEPSAGARELRRELERRLRAEADPS